MQFILITEVSHNCCSRLIFQEGKLEFHKPLESALISNIKSQECKPSHKTCYAILQLLQQTELYMTCNMLMMLDILGLQIEV